MPSHRVYRTTAGPEISSIQHTSRGGLHDLRRDLLKGPHISVTIRDGKRTDLDFSLTGRIVFSTRLEHKIIICKLTPGPDSDSVLDVQGQYIDTSAYAVNISLTSDEVGSSAGFPGSHIAASSLPMFPRSPCIGTIQSLHSRPRNSRYSSTLSITGPESPDIIGKFPMGHSTRT